MFVCVWCAFVEDGEEVDRSLHELLTRNQKLVDIKVDALLRRVESMVGECLVVVDAAATAQNTLRSFHSTGRAATVASTIAAAAGARALYNNYLLLLPNELLELVRLWPSLYSGLEFSG
jgi:hypothetical protein